MKEYPIPFKGEMVRAILDGRKTVTRRVMKSQPNLDCDKITDVVGGFVDADGKEFKSKYGKPGDRLWVKETWGRGSENNVCHPSDEMLLYRATDPGWDDNDTGFTWKPSIHMPRWASRITLEVVSVRVERLQDVTEEDAKREGVGSVAEFCELWEKINGPGSWDANPWVLVVEFKMLEEPK